MQKKQWLVCVAGFILTVGTLCTLGYLTLVHGSVTIHRTVILDKSVTVDKIITSPSFNYHADGRALLAMAVVLAGTALAVVKVGRNRANKIARVLAYTEAAAGVWPPQPKTP